MSDQPPDDIPRDADGDPLPRHPLTTIATSGATAVRHSSSGRIIGHVPSQATLDREKNVLRLRRKGLTFQQIGDELGFSKRSAWESYYRAIGREQKTDVRELRDAASAREHDLLEAVWGKAMDGDDAAFRNALRAEQRLARLHGYDHADGVAERIVEMQASKLRMVALALGGALEELGLTQDQAAEAKRRLFVKLREMSAMAEGDADAAIAEVESGGATA